MDLHDFYKVRTGLAHNLPVVKEVTNGSFPEVNMLCCSCVLFHWLKARLCIARRAIDKDGSLRYFAARTDVL